MKWYDLKSLNAKLESIRNADGVFSLRLTLEEPILNPEEPVSVKRLEKAVKNGWVIIIKIWL